MLSLIRIVFMLILISFMFVIGCSGEDPIHDKVRDAVHLTKEGKYSQAVDIYDYIVKSGAFANDKINLAIIYYNRALTQSSAGNYERAVADYAQALKLRPDFPTCLHNRSVVYEKMGDFAKAIADIKSLLELEPSDEDAIKRLRYLKGEISTD